MSVQPLPDDIDLESIESTKYTLIPYALQFPDEETELPVASFVANTDTREITSYVLSANGAWHELNTVTINEDSTIITNTGESIYQSFLGVTGPSWEEFHELKEELGEFVQISPEMNSTFIHLSNKIDSTRSPSNFCTCSNPDIITDTYMAVDSVSIKVSVCKSCGNIHEIDTTVGEESILINNSTELTLSNLVPSLDSSNITNITDDLFLYTSPNWDISTIDGFAVLPWWESQKQNHKSTQYLPTEHNFTAFIKNDLVVGGVIWNQILQTYPVIDHIWLTEDISDEEVSSIIRSWGEYLDHSTIYINKPYIVPSKIDDLLTPIDYVTGSIQFESEPINT